MNTKKKVIKKEYVLAAIAALASLMNLITPLFTVVRGGSDFLSGSEYFYANGYTLAFDGYPVIVEGCGAWLRVYCVFHLCVALVAVIMIALVALIKRSLSLRGFGIASVIISAVMSLMYTVNGFIAYGAASDYAGLYYECSTAAFIPLVISVFVTVSYFVIIKKMPDEFEL